MTLDIKKYLANLIQKEAKISHFQVRVDAGKAQKLKQEVQASIRAEFGESYLQDADFIVFFEKAESWAEADKKKLFELVNRALGKDANLLSQSDFKSLPAKDAEKPEDGDDDEAAQPEDAAQENVQDNNTLFLKITMK